MLWNHSNRSLAVCPQKHQRHITVKACFQLQKRSPVSVTKHFTCKVLIGFWTIESEELEYIGSA